jgi:hypothetical protein
MSVGSSISRYSPTKFDNVGRLAIGGAAPSLLLPIGEQALNSGNAHTSSTKKNDLPDNFENPINLSPSAKNKNIYQYDNTTISLVEQ